MGAIVLDSMLPRHSYSKTTQFPKDSAYRFMKRQSYLIAALWWVCIIPNGFLSFINSSIGILRSLWVCFTVRKWITLSEMFMFIDYQWNSTTPIKGEKLTDGKFMARYGAMALRLSIKVSHFSQIIY